MLTATLARSLLRGLLWACNESYALYSQLLHTLGTPEVPVCNSGSEPELHALDESSEGCNRIPGIGTKNLCILHSFSK